MVLFLKNSLSPNSRVQTLDYGFLVRKLRCLGGGLCSLTVVWSHNYLVLDSFHKMLIICDYCRLKTFSKLLTPEQSCFCFIRHSDKSRPRHQELCCNCPDDKHTRLLIKIHIIASLWESSPQIKSNAGIKEL